MKNIIKFVCFFILLLLSGFIFRLDPLFYDNLNKPFFTLPNFLYGIVWSILYILISISIVKVSNSTNIIQDKDYFYTLLSNYFSIYSFSLFFFGLKSPIFGFVACIAVLISSILLLIETKRIIHKFSYILLPYSLFSIYAVILSGTIFFMNF